MVTVSVSVLGDTVIQRRFLRIGADAADLSPAWDEILDAFEDWTGEQFASSGTFFGTPWEPLKDETIEQKRALGVPDPGQALVRTGALFLSLQGGPGSVREVGPGEAAWGTRNRNAMWHHGRVRSAFNDVPRRPIFEPQEARRRWVMKVLQRRVFGGMG